LVARLREVDLPCWLVDDGSSAACATVLDALAAQHAPWLHLVRLPQNRGKGAAVVAGMRSAFAAGCTHAIQIDADCQHDPRDIPKFIAAARERPDAIVNGVPVYDASIPKVRLYGREITNKLARVYTWSREIGDAMCVAKPLQPLGGACLGQGDLATARRHFEEALERARSLGDKREIAGALNCVAQLYRVEGALDTAELLFESMVALMRETGDKENIAIGLLNRAMVAISRSSVASARDLLLEILAINDEIASRAVGQSVLEASCGLAALGKDWQRAARLYGAAEAQSASTGLHRDPADEAFLAPRVKAARDALGAAAFASAEAQGRALGYEGAIAETRAWLKEALHQSQGMRVATDADGC
jgi:tetratricopeptide (TPR) repeat protein